MPTTINTGGLNNNKGQNSNISVHVVFKISGVKTTLKQIKGGKVGVLKLYKDAGRIIHFHLMKCRMALVELFLYKIYIL